MLWKKQASEEVNNPNNASTSPPPPSRPGKQPWTNTSVALTVVVSVSASWAALRFYKRFLRRIPNISHLHPDALRTRSLYGYVTRVGDGDNFRFFHTPLGIFAGWGWLPSRRVQDLGKKELQDQTLHVRIAGVDAPECAHFGRPAQPYSAEALEWLKGTVEGRYVRVYPLRKDQYERVVGKVVSRWVRKDLGTAMIKTGCATVYEAKFGSEFAGLEEVYRKEEEKARAGGKGMWKAPGLVGRILGGKGEVRESPREYKNRMKAEDMAK